MASRLRRLLSFSSDGSHSDIVNSNEQRTSAIFRAPSPDNYENWAMPRIEVDTIYKIGTFGFVRAYSVKTQEEVFSLQNGLQTIAMIKQKRSLVGLQTIAIIKQNSIKSHIKANYRFIHISLV